MKIWCLLRTQLLSLLLELERLHTFVGRTHDIVLTNYCTVCDTPPVSSKTEWDWLCGLYLNYLWCVSYNLTVPKPQHFLCQQDINPQSCRCLPPFCSFVYCSAAFFHLLLFSISLLLPLVLTVYCFQLSCIALQLSGLCSSGTKALVFFPFWST